MRYRKIATADGVKQVSSLIIGSAVKMSALNRQELFYLYDRYLDAGGNCIDTARAYGGGFAEQSIGEYMRLRKNRSRLFLSTKCAHPINDGKARLTKAEILEDLDNSMKALGADYIDLLWLHKDDEDYSVEAVIDDVNAVIRSGRVGAVGCSNWHTGRIEKANRYAAQSGQQGFALSQIQWNLASTKEAYFHQYTTVVMDADSYDWYLRNKMAIFAFSPQAQGFFSKMAVSGPDGLNDMLYKCYYSETNLIRLKRLEQIAQERGVPVSVPALAYLLNNKLPCFVVFGATNRAMLEETLRAADFPMSEQEADALCLP